MTSSLSDPSAFIPITQRAQVVHLIQTALQVKEYRYARRIALAWISHFPGDLEVSLLNAQALLQAGQLPQAAAVLERICAVDPEYLDAQKLLAHVHQQMGNPDHPAKDCVVALGGRPLAKSLLPKWAVALREANLSLNGNRNGSKSRGEGQADPTVSAKIEGLVHQALLDNPPTPLAAIAHLKMTMKRADLPPQALADLAQAYHERWQDCVLFTLVLCDTWMDSGKEDQAVILLHQAATNDILGQVARRLWGENHPYRALWLTDLAIDHTITPSPLDLPIPAAVAAALGLNLLSTGRAESDTPEAQGVVSAGFTTAHSTAAANKSTSVGLPATRPTAPQRKAPLPKYQVPETLVSVQRELEQIAEQIGQPALGKADGRFPVYVIFTTRAGLEKLYGEAGAERLDLEMRRLAEAISRRKGWRAMLYYADRPDLAPGAAYSLTPAAPHDPWELKLALADLDAMLGKQGEMIGAVCIVGGPEVVPFHHLPNPVDDADFDVPSDNPYATRDENYFIPEWSLGRLPGGKEDDCQMLLNALTKAVQYHHHQAQSSQRSPLSWVAWFKQLTHHLPWLKRELPSLGYSAAVWRRASLSVFRSIGDPRNLLVSPPLQAPVNGKNASLNLPAARLSYFNLHGLPDSPEWYGQRDTFDPENQCDFPIALRPEDIGNGNGSSNGKVNQVVFSEACYGAHIISKNSNQAIALKFIKAGCQAFIGSTVTSYGSITSPLIAADLLGRTFWQFLREGYASGEALKRAKIVLAKEMHRRQGYLDGEDQKTLISFVLYGDPLYQVSARQVRTKMVIRALASPAQVKMVCDKQPIASTTDQMPPEVMSQVKTILAQYLPGMQGAQVSYHAEKAGCSGGNHLCPTAQFGAKSLPAHPPHRKVVVLSKQLQQASKTHRQYARLTLDEHGKLVKLVISR